MKSKIISILFILSSCAPIVSPIIQVESMTRGASGSSVFHEACNGHDYSRGLKLSGRDLYNVEIIISDETNTPSMRLWSPAYYGKSISTRLQRLPTTGIPRCYGTSLTTEIFRASDGDILRWKMELAIPDDKEGTASVVLRSETPIVAEGVNSSVNFSMGGHIMTAKVNVSRGAYGILEDTRLKNESRPAGGAITKGSLLPDEKYGRTLEEMRMDSARRSQ